jgi:NADH-quinone oxidoreductase subunit E
METKKISEIIQKNSEKKGGLISILEAIQEEFTYLPETALRLVAQETGHSLTDIYGVATFYKAFSLKPKGRHCVSACLGTACHVRGAQKIKEEIAQQLSIKPGETTPDNEITFETVNCLGACALGPIVISDGHYFANVTAGKVKEILRETREGSYGDGESRGYEFPLEASCPQCNRSLMDSENCLDGYPSISLVVSSEGKDGWMRMPSLYGHFGRIHEHDVPANTIVGIYCPHCRSLLKDGISCVECGALLASLKINGGDGVLRICTREGCNGHLLELNQARV